MAHSELANGHQIFKPIAASRAFQDVLGQLVFAIRSGQYPAGSKLPTAEMLSSWMEVSRPTVAEAIRLLSAFGVVEVRRGATGGTEVLTPTIPSELLQLSGRRLSVPLRALVEARHVVELELARLACARASDADFAEMQRAVNLLEPARGDFGAWIHANDLFHYLVADAADSEVLATYSHEIMKQLAIELDGFDETYTNFEHTVDIHQATLDALRTRDPERVEKVMVEHLRELEEVAVWYNNPPASPGASA